MRLRRRADDSGADSTPIRWRTEVTALVKAASAASRKATVLL